MDVAAKGLVAMAPVLVMLLAFDRLDVFNLIRIRTIGGLVLGGALVAGASFLVNWRVMDGFPIGFSDYSKYVAPIVEETLKAIPVIALFALNRIGFKLDAAIAGFAIGAGFSLVENAWFLRLMSDANFSAWLVRGFGTAIMHGGATAAFAVVSHEFTEGQAQTEASRYWLNPVLFLPGLALAIFAHSAFNHFPNDPMLAMATTLLIVPMTLFLVFARSERATHAWLKADRDAHIGALEDIRAGRFAESGAGKAIAGMTARLAGVSAADVFAYVELKMELVLRAEELILAAQETNAPQPGPAERDKFTRLAVLEKKLGRSVLAAIAPHLGFTRNDLWELERLRLRVVA